MRYRATSEPASGGRRQTAIVSASAIGSALAATSCCLPVLPSVLAAGIAGGSAFLAGAKPYLLAASVLLVGYGFFQARRLRRCNRRPGMLTSLLLWTSAVFVFASIFLPQVMANAAADLLRH